MDHPPKKSSNQIFEVVRQFQIIRKWKKLSSSSSSSSSSSAATMNCSSLRRAASFPQDGQAAAIVPKGCFAVLVGEGQKRFVVPTRVLAHPAFRELLREAEEEFGFRQKGVLRIPCEVFVFEHVMRVVEGMKDKKRLGSRGRRFVFRGDNDHCDARMWSGSEYVSSPDSGADTSRHCLSPPACR